METVTSYEFGNSSTTNKDEQKRKIFVNQLISEKEDYGLYVWPSALVLSEYVYFIGVKQQLNGKSVIELGAGCGLPGCLASTFNTKFVLLTDKDIPIEILENLNKSILLNKNKEKGIISACCFTYGDFVSHQSVDHWNLLSRNWDFILGADLLYDVQQFEDVIATVVYLFDCATASHSQNNNNNETTTPHSPVFITAYEERSTQNTLVLLKLLEQWKLRVVEIPLSVFYPSEKLDLLGGKTIRLFLIKN